MSYRKILEKRRIKKTSSLNKILFFDQIYRIPGAFLLLILSIVFISLILLYSAGGGIDGWCLKQFFRFLIGFFLMITVALTPIKTWYSISYILYAISLACLLLTSFLGVIGMGAQRWINLFFIQFQPSELMRIALIITLARYFNDNTISEKFNIKQLLIPIFLVLVPVLITMEQPDLGTAMLLLICSGAMFFFVGINIKFFISIFVSFAALVPIFWHFLHDYQKNRIFMFLNPESDPLGAGYHIIQSKIAIGSGGFLGKGFLSGTQSALNFLPEKQTDFIFTLLSEEFGFIGVMILMVLYCLFIILNFSFALQSRNTFNRLTIAGITFSFGLYAIINIAMVVGFLPVVGIPLPLVSYGGTSLVTMMISFGIMLSAISYKHKTNCIDRFSK